MSFGFPDIHGAAHNQQEVVGGERRNRLALVQHDDIHGVAAACEKFAEQPGGLVVHMLKYQGTFVHGAGPIQKGSGVNSAKRAILKTHNAAFFGLASNRKDLMNA